jgi:uncharacterized membrane protein YoaK (UPF0700 family)
MTGGYFVSFMSGNSTRLGVGLFRAAAEAGFAASLVLGFVLGVVAGGSSRRLIQRNPEAAILAMLAALLTTCGYVASLGFYAGAAVLLAAAMGAENTIFAEAGEVRFGLTYMTGTLVRVGKGLVAEVFGEAHLRWAPHLLLWLSLVLGAALGAAAYGRLGPTAIWMAAAAVALLAPLSPGLLRIHKAAATEAA